MRNPVSSKDGGEEKMNLKKGDFIRKGSQVFEVMKSNKDITLRSEDGWDITVKKSVVEKAGYSKDIREERGKKK